MIQHYLEVVKQMVRGFIYQLDWEICECPRVSFDMMKNKVEDIKLSGIALNLSVFVVWNYWHNAHNLKHTHTSTKNSMLRKWNAKLIQVQNMLCRKCTPIAAIHALAQANGKTARRLGLLIPANSPHTQKQMLHAKDVIVLKFIFYYSM